MTNAAPRTATAEQARLLLDVTLRPLLGQLMQRACSAAEVARAQQISLQRAHYLLGKLLAAGILELDSVQPRAGRAIRRYRTAPRWFVPFEVTGAETLEAFVAAQIVPRIERFVRLTTRQIGAAYTHWGYWLEQENGASNLRMGDPDAAAHALFEGDEPFLLNIGTAHLTVAQASELKRRLLAILDDLQTPAQGEATDYTIGLLLARGDVG